MEARRQKEEKTEGGKATQNTSSSSRDMSEGELRLDQ
jgi:hypothetical protein